LMQQANESLGLTACDHIRAIRLHARRKLFDFALVNNHPVSPPLLAKYEAEGQGQVKCDTEDIEDFGVHCIADNFLDEGDVVRHDTQKLATTLLRLAYAPQEFTAPVRVGAGKN
jgi:2-phospho-L-lactate transferase/gluconeogenesis factor (CofD/UPF0052 family)